MISLLTYPDITQTGFNLVMLNSKAELQSKITAAVAQCNTTTNIVLYDLVTKPEQLDYNFHAISVADLIVFQEPPLINWITGFVVPKLNCYYWEFDRLSLNTLYKMSLRQLTDENLTGVVNNAIQRKCNTTLQFLSENAK